MTIKEYQRECFLNYKASIGYGEEYKYLFGNPINTLVPIETATNKFMIVGAYPSAKFCTIKNISNTPVCDNDSPFSNESYFDGSTVRCIPSGQELNDVILNNIGIERNDCWITDLVKVFLFKQGHIDRYEKLKANVFSENRSRFKKYASKSIVWLEREIEIAKPKLIILLGLEVIASVFGISENKAKEYIDGEVKSKVIGGKAKNIICLPHPGILMRKFDRNPWPERFNDEIAPKVKAIVKELNDKK